LIFGTLSSIAFPWSYASLHTIRIRLVTFKLKDGNKIWFPQIFIADNLFIRNCPSLIVFFFVYLHPVLYFMKMF
jgi:hypothetical protein